MIQFKYHQFKSSLDSKMQDLENKNSTACGRWTKEQHFKFLQGLRIYGKNWKKIEQLLPNRTGSQIRSHAQKFFLKTKESEISNNLNQFSPQTGDLQAEPQELTHHSKSTYEEQICRDDLSYYLGRIIELSSVKGSLNFWTELVDCNRTISNFNHTNKNSSFMTFIKNEDSDVIRSNLTKFSKP